jgi:putative membrane protein
MANRLHPNAAMMWLTTGAIQLLLLILAGMVAFSDSTLSSLGISAFPPWVVGALFGVLDVGVIGVVILSWLRVTYVISPDEIVIQKGLLRADEQIHELDRVEAIEVKQTLWGRLFNYGNIYVRGPGFPEPLVLLGVTDPTK